MSDKNDFFIGWSPDTPKADRRFFLGAGLALTLGAGGLAALVAREQNAVGPGSWDQAAVKDYTGMVTVEPYPMLTTKDIDGTPITAFLACLGKCGVKPRLNSMKDGPVTVEGSLIQRGRHAMIAVSDSPDWITPLDGAAADPELALPPLEALGDVALSGEILDTKCWFGAMRPSEGKVHKACAALCIRGGLPPALYAKDTSGRTRLLIMTNQGEAHGWDILPFVADPVRVAGQAYACGDILFLDSPVSGISRI